MPNKKDWSEYYEFMREKPPSALLVAGLKYLKQKDKAIDIGGGSLRDTRHLLQEGLDVTVIDSSPLLMDEAARIKDMRLHPMVVSFENYTFPKNEYNLASAIFALNFCNPLKFDAVFWKIIDSLKPGGIFCSELYGDHDEWSKLPGKTYPSKDRVMKLLVGLEIIRFIEEKTDKKDMSGEVKYKHVFQFIIRK